MPLKTGIPVLQGGEDVNEKKKGGVNNGRKTNPQAIEAKIRAAQALELRKEGKTYAAIAEEVGYRSAQAAFDAVKRSLDAIVREPAEALLKLELERLDEMQEILFINAKAGDIPAVMAVIKIMERRTKFVGLDAPVKTENKTEVSAVPSLNIIFE